MALKLAHPHIRERERTQSKEAKRDQFHFTKPKSPYCMHARVDMSYTGLEAVKKQNRICTATHHFTPVMNSLTGRRTEDKHASVI